MTTDISITYINKSDDHENPTTLVFMKHTESDFAAYSTAWQVIKNIGYNSWHKFIYTVDTSVVATWDNGRSATLPLQTSIGKNYAFKNTPSGFSLIPNSDSNAENKLDVVNEVSTPEGISVVAFKDDSPISTKNNVGRNQKVEFVFHPRLYFGVTSKYEVGDMIDSAVMGEEFTEISLEGLSSVFVEINGNAASGYNFSVTHKTPAVA